MLSPRSLPYPEILEFKDLTLSAPNAQAVRQDGGGPPVPLNASVAQAEPFRQH